MPLGTEVGLGPNHVMLNGNPSDPTERAQQLPHFSVHVYCGETAGWMRMLLGTEVGLGAGERCVR